MNTNKTKNHKTKKRNLSKDRNKNFNMSHGYIRKQSIHIVRYTELYRLIYKNLQEQEQKEKNQKT